MQTLLLIPLKHQMINGVLKATSEREIFIFVHVVVRKVLIFIFKLLFFKWNFLDSTNEYVNFIYHIKSNQHRKKIHRLHFIILYCFGRISKRGGKIFQLRKRKHLNCKKEILFMKIRSWLQLVLTWCIHFYDTTTHRCHSSRKSRTKAAKNVWSFFNFKNLKLGLRFFHPSRRRQRCSRTIKIIIKNI